LHVPPYLPPMRPDSRSPTRNARDRSSRPRHGGKQNFLTGGEGFRVDTDVALYVLRQGEATPRAPARAIGGRIGEPIDEGLLRPPWRRCGRLCPIRDQGSPKRLPRRVVAATECSQGRRLRIKAPHALRLTFLVREEQGVGGDRPDALSRLPFGAAPCEGSA
jgi:hypothetical protein